MKFVAIILPVLLLAPMLAFAQVDLQGGAIGQFIQNIINFMNSTLVPLVFAIAFLVFLWGMFKAFILGGSDEGKQTEGKQLMMYAIVGFVVMVSLWGIVNLVARGFGLTDQQINNIPNLPANNP